MGKNFLILFALAAILISPRQLHAVVLYPLSDATTSSGSPDTNFNNYSGDLDAELWTGNFSDGSNTRTYLKFNLTGLSNMHGATLYLYNGLGSGGRSSFDPASVGVYPAISSDWGERSITWSNQPALGPLAATSNVGTATGWYAWNITSLAQASYSGGVMSLALTSTEAGHIYYAREDSYGYMPYVDASMPEPATIITFGSFGLIFLPFIKRRPML